MSSCAASSYTCFPKASSAFATSDSSPTGDAPLSCRFASNYSAQYRRPRPNHKPPRSSQRARFGSVPNVAAPWWSSRDLPLPSSNSVLHSFSPEPPHETKIPTSLHRCASPPPASCALVAPKPAVRFQTRLNAWLLPHPNCDQTHLLFAFSSSTTCSRNFSHYNNTIQYA